MGTIKSYQNDFQNLCFINDDTDFKGTLKYKNPVEISGKFKGDIMADSILIITEEAYVEANVKVNVLVLAGTLRGEVEAREKVDILPTGKLYGNITTAKLRIADGVIFDGTCKMIKV